MLFEALGKLKHQIIISSVVMMILGLLMLIIPEQYDGILVHVLGYTAILLGAVMVWDFIGGNRKLKDFILFIAALLLMVLGIYVLVSGDNTLVVLSGFFGILLIVDGFHSAVHAWMYARRAGKKWWWLLLLLCMLLIGAGIIILNNPWWHTTHSFVKVIGGTVLFASAVGIVRLILVWPLKNV